ncbi:TetR/AcrR family transcriptional regulator C-terminal domain-containing protein [Dactylosporangium sp. AC04546]|uniref:TetR/AcrR family transcriptional regulator n=1 Tax=Dactylosporangium sp. AC04546 TaxID=2862460 RepID=UPI001EDCF9F2|nr:TetR/AcrR family transcriptional regulator C-terminal domain-containing protein [Dactylosporangium sp. AC04546]WVK89404.1 TetR/AcrR family transcriptional regulator C-terminal domain-containing protein [Dactylosporangium sp. AC04546]
MKTEPRLPLTRERVLHAAIQVADEGGLAALTMRRLAEVLGAEAMSLYYHVANKDEVFDGIVEVVATEINDLVDKIDLPVEGPAWKAAMRARILTAREVFLRHPWLPKVFESRTDANFAVLRYNDGIIRILRAGGFTNDQCHHAMHALGSRAMGFVQELFTPGPGPVTPEALDGIRAMAGTLPHLAGMLLEVAHDDPDSTVGWCDDQSEFEFGLDLLLDGLDRLRP